MERVLSGRLGNVLVGADTSSFESLARKLFVFVGDKVSAEGEVVDGSALSTQVKDPDLILTSATVESLNREGGPWNQGHPGCIEILDMVCSCSTGSSELDDVPSWCLQGELSAEPIQHESHQSIDSMRGCSSKLGQIALTICLVEDLSC